MQTASLKTPSSSPVAAVVKAVAAGVIIGLCIAIFPVVPVLLPFLVLPLAHVVARWGARVGAVVIVITVGLIYPGMGLSAAVLALFLLAGVGMVLGEGLRRGWSFSRTFGLTVGAGFLAFVLWGVVARLAFGLNLSAFKQSGYAMADDLGARYSQMGISQASAQTAAEWLHKSVDIIPFLAPGLAGMGAVLLAACTLGLAYWIFPRLRNNVAVAWSFRGFRMHWATAYTSIIALAMLLFWGGDAVWRHVLVYVGINVLLVSQTLFFVQGLALACWFARVGKLGPGSRGMLYFVAVLGQVFLQLTGLVGLFDSWVDFRKRFAQKTLKKG